MTERGKGGNTVVCCRTASSQETLQHFSLLPTEGDLFPLIPKILKSRKTDCFCSSLFLSFLNDVLLLFLKNVSSIRFFCFLNFVFWGIWGCFHFKRRVQLPYSLLGLLLQYQRCLPPRDVNFAIVS